MNYKKNKGFTLVELLIVIAIIGILAGIVIVQLQGSTGDAAETVIKKNVQSAEGLYAQRVSDVDDNDYSNLAKDFCKTGTSGTDLKMRTILQTIFKSTPYAVSGTTGIAAAASPTDAPSGWAMTIYTSNADLDDLTPTATAGVTPAFTTGNASDSSMPSAGCASSKDGWVIWARINTESTSNTYCRDANGYQGEITVEYGPKTTAANKHPFIANDKVTCGSL